MSGNGKEDDATGEVTRRGFLRNGGKVLLATAAYQVVSVFGGGVSTARADFCNVGCTNLCVTSCTSCTTVNCTSSTAPEPSPPQCVQGFGGKDNTTSGKGSPGGERIG